MSYHTNGDMGPQLLTSSVEEREEARVVGPIREMPICGGKCRVRHPKCVMGAERAIGGVVKIPRSRVTSGTDPGLSIPLTGSPPGGIIQVRLACLQ
jgi:hypothetical protein